jgi:AcrR family transcriptional regulator
MATPSDPERTPSGGPRRRRRTASDEKILAAAKELFLDDRYDGVNLERVAERAGVSRQTVYNRFGSKETVFREMIRYHWSAFPEPVDTAPSPATTDSAEDVLRAFARSLQRFADETDQIRFARLVVAESARLPWIADEFHRLGKGPVVAAFTRRLDDLVDRGLLHCPDTQLAARQFMGLVQEFLVWPRVMSFTEEITGRPGAEVVIEEAIHVFLARYARDPATPPT